MKSPSVGKRLWSRYFPDFKRRHAKHHFQVTLLLLFDVWKFLFWAQFLFSSIQQNDKCYADFKTFDKLNQMNNMVAKSMHFVNKRAFISQVMTQAVPEEDSNKEGIEAVEPGCQEDAEDSSIMLTKVS